MDPNFRLYFQKDNHLLGNCLSIVYRPTDEEKKYDSLTSNEIVVFIKSELIHKYINSKGPIDKIFSKSIFNQTYPIYLRVASECFFGMYGDSHCDCDSQRLKTLRAIKSIGQGVYIHIPHEAQGRGLFYKAEELSIQVSGYDRSGNYIGKKSLVGASELILGKNVKLDVRRYSSVKNIVKSLDLNKYNYTLLTKNFEKANQIMDDLDISIVKIHDVGSEYTIENLSEALTKLYQKFYKLTEFEIKHFIHLVDVSNYLPVRLIQIAILLREAILDGCTFNCSSLQLYTLVNSIITNGSRI